MCDLEQAEPAATDDAVRRGEPTLPADAVFVAAWVASAPLFRQAATAAPDSYASGSSSR